MSRRDLVTHIEDMLTAAADIGEAVAGMDLYTFLANRMLQKAVVRDLEVIGEAARNLPQEARERCPDVPWTKLVAMRNRLIHEYFGVDATIVYRTAVVSVPALIGPLKALQAELDAGSSDPE